MPYNAQELKKLDGSARKIVDKIVMYGVRHGYSVESIATVIAVANAETSIGKDATTANGGLFQYKNGGAQTAIVNMNSRNAGDANVDTSSWGDDAQISAAFNDFDRYASVISMGYVPYVGEGSNISEGVSLGWYKLSLIHI